MKRKASKKNETILPFYWLKVWWAVFKTSMSKNSIYKVELIFKFVRMLMVIVIQLILVKSIYSSSKEVVGWSLDQYYLLLGIYNVVNYLSWGIFNVNFWRTEEKVLKGEYDFLLLYPTGSIFSTSFMEFFPDDAISSLSGFILIGYYFFRNWSEITVNGVLMMLVAMVAAFIIWYAIYLFVTAFNFISVKNGLLEFTKSLTRVGSFPSDIFSGTARVVFHTVFPVALIAAVPSRLLTLDYGWLEVGYTWFIALALLSVVVLFWRWAIKSYTSMGG